MCLPENYLQANPQLGTANYTTNLGSSDYHSLQTQVSIRPNRSGISFTSTYSFSKTIAAQTGGNVRDPRDNRNVERFITTGSVRHDFRSNGTFSVPMGPNQFFFGNSSGVFARAIEGWRMSIIYNATGARPANLGGGVNNFYSTNTFDVVGPWVTPKGQVRWDGPSSNTNPVRILGPDGIAGTADDGHDNGTFFGGGGGRGGLYFVADDPQCNRPGITDSRGVNINNNCTLSALAAYADYPGAPAADFIDAATGRPAVFVLQNPQPGTIGTLGKNTLWSFGRWSLDANLSKDFRVRESTRVQFRIDARNVLNHPQPATPTLNILSGTTFGQITTKTGNRTVAGNISINFTEYPFK
jgi:hypothetical protein